MRQNNSTRNSDRAADLELMDESDLVGATGFTPDIIRHLVNIGRLPAPLHLQHSKRSVWLRKTVRRWVESLASRVVGRPVATA